MEQKCIKRDRLAQGTMTYVTMHFLTPRFIYMDNAEEY